MPDVTVETRVDASPADAYGLVSNVTRMGEWSPETTVCRWLGDSSSPVAGARFRGVNRRGWRRWATTCTVVDAEAGSRFAFDVKFGPFPISHWSYEFAADAEGCRITETWTDRRPRWIRRMDPVVMGIGDRAEHNRESMKTTLDRLGRAAGGASNP